MKIDNKEVRLPKKFKAKWLEALRSGKFKQGNSMLYDEQSNSYCCLGVSCKIVHPKIDINQEEWILSHLFVDIKSKVPKILRSEDNEVVQKLSNMNDGFKESKKSFKQIARWIEKNL